jgi:fascin 1
LCESEERDTGSRFQISIAEDNSGRWALKNEQRGYFLGGTPEKLMCTAKAPGKGEYWSVHLAARPQVSIVKIVFFSLDYQLEKSAAFLPTLGR